MLTGANIVRVLQFDMMESEQMVQDMICVYNKNTREFHTIVRVGRDVCGCASPPLHGRHVPLYTSGAALLLVSCPLSSALISPLHRVCANVCSTYSGMFDRGGRGNAWQHDRLCS